MRYMNDPLSKITSRCIGTHLGFPENQPITALDIKCHDGEPLLEMTKKAAQPHRYGIEENTYQARLAQSNGFDKVCRSDYKSQSKITNEVFSMVLANPIVDDRFTDELFRDFDPFKVPNFEAEERARIEAMAQQMEMIDFGDEGQTEEEIQKRKEEADRQLKKAIEDREIAFRRALFEQEKRTEQYRWDRFVLNFVSKYLMPGGILVFVTPKEFIDGQICFKLASSYEDVKIFRLEDEEYAEQRKCIIFAKKRRQANRDQDAARVLMQYRLTPYKEIPEISFQQTPMYQVPMSKPEWIENFRVGPITGDEVLGALGKSPLISKYVETYGSVLNNEAPQPPTQLHKGHVSLLLASGLLNGHIGTGPDQHLVKGSVIKMSKETTEEEESEDGTDVRIKEREFFNIGIKYLDRHGEFHRLL
ncbi:hypothetical protein GZH47_33350 (plasmid) [Paenibacillus rhizovicinus]|uniref:DUF6094 domain-containing protein n=1 Tax=Paenibacillus rhizovicinus TaxID=2704463 RepID=A0A6C0PCZ1_9BACL|nr:DUF6094 domain-containing protein [Paenibacillus rhizovicinus]QHW35782.1 hypothetical protein GZH47_33350 [Paenibacillus rhizovicinus]